MSRKLFNHFLKSKYIDIYKDQPVTTELKKDWWLKYIKREKTYKTKSHEKNK
jgi:hypothetical protein